MACECGKFAVYKVVNFCTVLMSRNNNSRYECYCGDCFMNIFNAKQCCNGDNCINAILLDNFMWHNAYEYATNIGQIFKDVDCEIYDDKNEIKKTLASPDDNNYDHTTINSEDTENIFPHNLLKGTDVPKKHKVIKINLFIRKNKQVQYIIRDGNEWKIDDNKQDILSLTFKGREDSRLFISRFYFSFKKQNDASIVVLKRTDESKVDKVEKVQLKGILNEEEIKSITYEDKALYFVNGIITTEQLPGKQKIYWEFK